MMNICLQHSTIEYLDTILFWGVTRFLGLAILFLVIRFIFFLIDDLLC